MSKQFLKLAGPTQQALYNLHMGRTDAPAASLESANRPDPVLTGPKKGPQGPVVAPR